MIAHTYSELIKVVNKHIVIIVLHTELIRKHTHTHTHTGIALFEFAQSSENPK